MKKTIALLSLVLLSVQSIATAAPLIDISYTGMLKSKLEACRNTLEGCESEEELNIASFNDKVLNSNDLENYLVQDKQKSIFIPLSLTDSELLTLAAATSLGVVAFKNDQEIMDVIQNNKSQISKPITTVGNFLGTPTPGLAIAAGSYFMGVCFENNKLKRVGLFIVGSNLATSIVTLAAKTSMTRSRPRTGDGPYSFFQPYSSDTNSFYSGHTAQAFSVATVISEMYKDDYPVVPYVAYGIAAITGYARMSDRAHWASDVIVGAIAGHLVTKLAMNIMDSNADGRSGIEIYPGIDPQTGSFMIYLEYKGRQPFIPLRCSKMIDGSVKTEACLEEAFNKAKKH